MTRKGHDLLRKPIWMLSVMFLLASMGFVGCSIAGERVLPANLEDRISSSNGTADDHLAAALLYQRQADLAKTKAVEYEKSAASIRQIEDPKGFRRNALLTAAQKQRQTAEEMQELYASHEAKAQTMLGMQQLQ